MSNNADGSSDEPTTTHVNGRDERGAERPAAVTQTLPSPAPAASAAPDAGQSRRLAGVDVARGVAVLGMFVVHVGLGWSAADGSNPLYEISSGRSSALFAMLAGVSIALLSGGARPKAGPAMGVALWRVLIRGLVLLPLGTALTMMGTPVSVILAYYAVFFMLAVPFLGERWRVVAAAAVVLAAVGPVASFYLRSMILDGALGGAVSAVRSVDPFYLLAGDGVVNFLLTGAYPAITWMPFVLAGLAIGRLDLRSDRVRVKLVVVGSAVAALAYGVSWLGLNVLGGAARLAASPDPETGGPLGRAGLAERLGAAFHGSVPVGDPAWLLVSTGHSGTPFEVFGAGGVAVAVLGACLLVAPRVRWVLAPLAAVGALALSVYVGHILVIYAAQNGWLDGTVLAFVAGNLAYSVLLGFVGGAWVWWMLLRRGPLEWPLHVVSSWVAERIP